MKKKLLWILGICLLLAATVIPAKPTYAEDEKTYISGGGVNRAIFGDGSITDAQSGEETDSLFIGAAPEQRVDGYLTYSEAVSYMRSQMVSRRTGFLLKVAMAADLKQDGVYEAFLKDVCAETDSPVEGDYLLMHFRNYGYSGTRENKTVSGMYLYTLNITFKYLSTAMEERMLNLEIDNILKQLNLEQDNEYQKVQKIYDYIASNITYDNEAFEMLKKVEALENNKTSNDNTDYYSYLDQNPYWGAWSAYGAVFKKTCVCQGYANLFYRLAREAGLSVRSIRGTSFGGGHAWNIVRIGKYYYNVDVTWDAGATSYSYFLKNASTFYNHSRYSDYSTGSFNAAYPIAPDSFSAGNYNPNEYVTSVAIAQGEDIEMRLGSRRTFSAKVLPAAVTNKNIVWSSSDTNVATVDSTGKVTIKNLGTTIITARSVNNSVVYDTCHVTVTDTGWVDYDGTWRYIVSGSRVTGWKKIGSYWYYFDSYGNMKTGWVKTGGKWYYLNENGQMKTGWLLDNKQWYYLRADGSMATGWVKDKGYWYYLAENGSMKTGWIKVTGCWYYCNSYGQMQKGWLEDGGKWYYLTADGSMKKGWSKHGDDWYYFDNSGAMVTGAYTIGSTVYYFNSSGVWIP